MVGCPLWYPECSPTGCFSDFFVRTSKMAAPLWNFWLLSPLSSALAFLLPLYLSLLLGMKEPRFFLLFSRLPDRERDSHSASKQWPAESLPHFRHYQRANKAVSQRAGQAAFEVRCWESHIGGKKMTMKARRTRVKKESRTRKTKCITFASTRMSRCCLSSRDSPQLDADCLFCLAFLASIFRMFFPLLLWGRPRNTLWWIIRIILCPSCLRTQALGQTVITGRI